MCNYESDYIYINNLVNDLNSVDLNSIWNGNASEKLGDNLNSDVKDLVIQSENLNKYNEVLKLMDEYSALDRKINQLRASLPMGDDYESEISRTLILAEINALETQKNV